MFTKEELDDLRSCWILPDGKIWPVPNEQHDDNLPDGYYNDNWDLNKSIHEVEKRCFRMSFGWGWDAPISKMKIACDSVTDNQKDIIKYLLNSKIITDDQIYVLSRYFDDTELLREILGK